MNNSDHKNGDENPKSWMTVHEAANRAEVTVWTIAYWCRTRWPELGRKIGGRWRINRGELNRLLTGKCPRIRSC